jgi:hypothetical protein
MSATDPECRGSADLPSGALNPRRLSVPFARPHSSFAGRTPDEIYVTELQAEKLAA